MSTSQRNTERGEKNQRSVPFRESLGCEWCSVAAPQRLCAAAYRLGSADMFPSLDRRSFALFWKSRQITAALVSKHSLIRAGRRASSLEVGAKRSRSFAID